MDIYIVTYRYICDKERGIWTPDRIQPDAYKTLEEAQRYIQKVALNPGKISDWYFQTDNFEEYYIRKVNVKG